MRDHARSIDAAQNLALKDFTVRYLVVEDIWIALGESLLIAWFEPVWNVVVDGFGNHAPGSGRAKGARPVWDTLHPGRTWASSLAAPAVTLNEITDRIALHLSREQRPYSGGDDIAIVDLMAGEE
jgi:hypothetical protein